MPDVHVIALLSALREAKEDVGSPTGTAKFLGICHAVDRKAYEELERLLPEARDKDEAARLNQLFPYADAARTLLHQLFESWPKYSGHEAFPVPGDSIGALKEEEQSKHEAAFYWAAQHRKLWEGDYGQLRRELLDFCIQQLESENATQTTPA